MLVLDEDDVYSFLVDVQRRLPDFSIKMTIKNKLLSSLADALSRLRTSLGRQAPLALFDMYPALPAFVPQKEDEATLLRLIPEKDLEKVETKALENAADLSKPLFLAVFLYSLKYGKQLNAAMRDLASNTVSTHNTSQLFTRNWAVLYAYLNEALLRIRQLPYEEVPSRLFRREMLSLTLVKALCEQTKRLWMPDFKSYSAREDWLDKAQYSCLSEISCTDMEVFPAKISPFSAHAELEKEWLFPAWTRWEIKQVEWLKGSPPSTSSNLQEWLQENEKNVAVKFYWRTIREMSSGEHASIVRT